MFRKPVPFPHECRMLKGISPHHCIVNSNSTCIADDARKNACMKSQWIHIQNNLIDQAGFSGSRKWISTGSPSWLLSGSRKWIYWVTQSPSQLHFLVRIFPGTEVRVFRTPHYCMHDCCPTYGDIIWMMDSISGAQEMFKITNISNRIDQVRNLFPTSPSRWEMGSAHSASNVGFPTLKDIIPC